MSHVQADVGPYGTLVAEHGLHASARAMIDEARDAARVLDVGCATGYIAGPLTAQGCAVTGFERNPESAAVARERCDSVIVGDIESPEDRARIPGGFDVILLGDVLEHLVDPWDALRFLRGRLAPHGVVVASIPNVAVWTVRLGLLRGRWNYTEAGPLDRTHLRFFTRATARALVRDAGLVLEHERFTPVEQEPGLARRAMPRLTDVLVRSLVRVWPELMAAQFVLRLRPIDRPR